MLSASLNKTFPSFIKMKFAQQSGHERIGRFTVTSHAETRALLLRLVGKATKLAAVFVVFTL